MRGHGGPAGPDLAALVRKASRHDGPWPTVSVWHGTADMTVAASNMDAIVEQWRLLHGLAAAPSQVGTVGGHGTRRWTDGSGRVLIEAHSIAGMGHGTPISPGEGCGAAMPHMLDVGVCSTQAIAGFWGIADEEADAGADRSIDHDTAARPARPALAALSGVADVSGVKKVIEDALRAAGLMR
jgi:poly(3-hydroxybutyrate) depolymerase